MTKQETASPFQYSRAYSEKLFCMRSHKTGKGGKGWYDKNIHKTHVTLWDLGEVDENFSDDDAEGVTLSLQVTIFSESDEVELAREIKKLMKEKDFSFEGRNGDDSKPEDGIYMKAQRFSKFYEMEE